MGRNKIKIEKINHDRIRQVTFYKRKRGLLKKAMELSLLCDAELLLCIKEKSSNKCLVYSSNGNIQGFIKNNLNSENRLNEIVTNINYVTLFSNEKYDCEEVINNLTQKDDIENCKEKILNKKKINLIFQEEELDVSNELRLKFIRIIKIIFLMNFYQLSKNQIL